MNQSQTTASDDSAPGRIRDTTTISAAKDCVYCELEGEAVILSLNDGIYYGLNAVGLRIWELIQQPRSLGGILDALVEEYEIGREDCQRDVLALLEELLDKKLIEIAL